MQIDPLLSMQGIILAFISFLGIQVFKMNGCIKRIEGRLMKNES
jgi:hypothetical protein